MKTLILSIAVTIGLSTSAFAGICSWIDRVDIMGSAKGSALLSGGWSLVTTGNPAVAVVNGVVTGTIVGGGLYTVDYTCDFVEDKRVQENTVKFVSNTYELASDYATGSYNYVYNWWTKEEV